MGMREFYTWLAFLQMEPPDQAENARTAALMAQITNVAGRALPKGKTVAAKDFLPKEKPRPQTREEQIAFMKGLKSDGS